MSRPTILLPRTTTLHVAQSGGPDNRVSYDRTIPGAPLLRAVIFKIEEGVDVNRRKFMSIKVGYNSYRNAKVLVMVRNQQAIEALQNLQRGDVVRLFGVNVHAVPADQTRNTVEFAAMELLVLDGVPQLTKLDHIDLPESQFAEEEAIPAGATADQLY